MLQPGGTPTKIVCLTQVVTADDLRDDAEYADIMEDMSQEGGKFGKQFVFFFTIVCSDIIPLAHSIYSGFYIVQYELLIIYWCVIWVQVTW